jgi:hypothetical protein
MGDPIAVVDLFSLQLAALLQVMEWVGSAFQYMALPDQNRGPPADQVSQDDSVAPGDVQGKVAVGSQAWAPVEALDVVP